MRVINRVQRIGAQAIVRTFNTVVTAVAKAEASIQSTQEKYDRKSTTFWVRMQSFTKTHPLRRLRAVAFRRFLSSFQLMAEAYDDLPLNKLETIKGYPIAPWEDLVDNDTVKASEAIRSGWAVRIAMGSSARNGVVDSGTATTLPASFREGGSIMTASRTFGQRTEQKPYIAELVALAEAVKSLPERLDYRAIHVFTRNKAAVLVMRNPRQQSGQREIRQLYASVQDLQRRGNRVAFFWLPSAIESDLSRAAKTAAKESTQADKTPQKRPARAYSTALRLALQSLRQTYGALPDNVRAYSKKIDIALPGNHTRKLYDELSWKEARILAQLRTGMTETRRGNLLYFLRVKTASDPKDWPPSVDVVKETIKFAESTERLDAQISQRQIHTQLTS
ncbi:reverse transcriptase [Colletotrichum tofieldiae]|uniref:Reverse transcriptase n=1 Tax=Colletotrichum tofieldiae TaxID=708197 RepID=A0A166LKG1_9PEZI|nr:reverse transcriptase [Colletotrichum tofieldiae]